MYGTEDKSLFIRLDAAFDRNISGLLLWSLGGLLKDASKCMDIGALSLPRISCPWHLWCLRINKKHVSVGRLLSLYEENAFLMIFQS